MSRWVGDDPYMHEQYVYTCIPFMVDPDPLKYEGMVNEVPLSILFSYATRVIERNRREAEEKLADWRFRAKLAGAKDEDLEDLTLQDSPFLDADYEESERISRKPRAPKKNKQPPNLALRLFAREFGLGMEPVAPGTFEPIDGAGRKLTV